MRATRQDSSCISVQHPESPPRIQSGADHSRSAHGDAATSQHATDSRSTTWAIPTLMGRVPDAPDTRKLLVNIHPALQCSIPGACLDSNLRIADASHPDAVADQDAGKVRSAILGPGPTSHSSASILYFCAASQGACDFQADSRTVHLKCSMRSRIYCSPTLLWCMRNCGKAAPQLRGDSGGPVEQYPPFAPVLARAREKGLGVDGETWLNPSVTFSDFEYLAIPHHRPGRRT